MADLSGELAALKARLDRMNRRMQKIEGTIGSVTQGHQVTIDAVDSLSMEVSGQRAELNQFMERASVAVEALEQLTEKDQ